MTPPKDANSSERRIKFIPTVNHQTMKKGFKPVKSKPMIRRFLVLISLFSVFTKLDLMESRICITPKISKTIPPAAPMMSLIVGSFTKVMSPNASTMTKENSIIVCAIEKIRPLLTPDLAP